MSEYVIPGGVAGTMATLHRMAQLIREGASHALILENVSPGELDAWLRQAWEYVPDGPTETIRTVARIITDFVVGGKMLGDCDDAAVIAGAMLCRSSVGSRCAASLVAVRSPRSPEFEHVFVLVTDAAGFCFLIDPTAPIDADYTDWEQLQVPIF